MSAALLPLLTRDDWRKARESVILGPPVSPRCARQWFSIPGCACDDPYHSAGRHHCRCGNEWFDGEVAQDVMDRLNPTGDEAKEAILSASYLNPCRHWFPEGAATGYLEETVKAETRESLRSAA